MNFSEIVMLDFLSMNQRKQHQVAVFFRHFVPIDVNHLFEHISFQESVTLFMDRL